MNDEDREKLNILIQGRSESTAIIIALAFGAVTILQMFGAAEVYSSSWIALSAAYWAILISAVRIFRYWVRSGNMIQDITKIPFKVLFPIPGRKDLEGGSESSFLDSKRFIYRHLFVIMTGVLIIGGFLVWLPISFHCGFGELPNSTC